MSPYREDNLEELSIEDFKGIKIRLASPEEIRSWSYGEVTEPETINYRTFKPEKNGLFCAKIFGPTTDWECLCGKFKRRKNRGVICDNCGVEVTKSKVRRERMGHIELAAPVSHVWFFKGMPSKIGLLLDMTMRELEQVLYFESHIVVDPGDTPLQKRELLAENEYQDALEEYGPVFEAEMGAAAVKKLLQQIDVEELCVQLRYQMRTETSKQRRKRCAKRLKVARAFLQSGNKPEWMILEVIPVIPPELRPLVPLEGGRFATSDLNDLYRRVINRDNRLKNLIELNAPEVIIRNEKRMLQEAVDALFDNGRRGRVIKGSNNRPLKSLADTLKGKQGRFRQNLLGKRVDYSGRSVIVVGPELKLHQCGLPKTMALELFKPFIYQKLEEAGLAATIKTAKEMVNNRASEVWDYLEEVIQEHPVLLNRAPTLHRLGMVAFEPLLVEGNAIKLHPLVCPPFNADFDGDQMAVHIPLSPEAQIEARELMLASKNLLSPAHGNALSIPSQDMVLGLYYLTAPKPGATGEGKIFSSPEEVLLAYQEGHVSTVAQIRFQYSGELLDLTAVPGDQELIEADILVVERQLITTTVGRVIFNESLPEGFPFINGIMRGPRLAELVNFCHIRYGNEKTVEMLDAVKELGFYYSTKSGITFGIEDMVIPQKKVDLIGKAEEDVQEVQTRYLRGEITGRERYNKVIDIWSTVTDDVTDAMLDEMKHYDREGTIFNPIYVMQDSGARGKTDQIRQLAGMRGLMAKPSGEIIETPILANFREGLNALEYFISTHGARKGLADTALKTADSGYLTRRLVDAAQGVVVTRENCETLDGIPVRPIVAGGEVVERLRDRILGRVALEDLVDPYTNEVLVKANEEITEDLANIVESAGIDEVRVRSVLTCDCRRGVCAMCFGRDLATGRIVEVGEAVGVIAAQSIGEPGTQLTMRTFHTGGTASRAGEATTQLTKWGGLVKFQDLSTIKDKEGGLIAMSKAGKIVIEDEDGREKERYSVVYGARIKVKDGEVLPAGATLLEWDPYSTLILTETQGIVQFEDIVEGETVREDVDELTGHSALVIIESADGRQEPRILIYDKKEKERESHVIPPDAHLRVDPGDEVYPGHVLAKIPRETGTTEDITGGLPRVEQLFEARTPADPATISEIDGVVRFGEVKRNKRRIIVENESGDQQEYLVSKGTYITVKDGEQVRAGDSLSEGPIDHHDMLHVLGEKKLQDYLLNEIQEIYRRQGIDIHDKHIELMIRQMMRWVEITEVGDTDFVVEEIVDKFEFQDINARVIEDGNEPAKGKPMLLGITKASLNTDSFISAASFQETTRVLTEASIEGKVDRLLGLKENVILGRLIPAGTGMQRYQSIELKADEEAIPKEEAMKMEEAEEAMPSSEAA